MLQLLSWRCSAQNHGIEFDTDSLGVDTVSFSRHLLCAYCVLVRRTDLSGVCSGINLNGTREHEAVKKIGSYSVWWIWDSIGEKEEDNGSSHGHIESKNM